MRISILRDQKRQIIILLLLSLFIVVLWFRKGLLFGAAEEGMPFYSPSTTAVEVGSVWQRDSTGFLAPTLLPEYPLMIFAKYVDLVFPRNFVQALVFFLLISSGIVGAYLLAGKIVKNNLVGLISSLFYFFNLYAMSQVWQRAIYGLMFGWAFLPLFLFLWVKLLERKKIVVWIIVFLILQIVFSYSYSMPNNVFVFWIPAGLYFLIKIIKERKNSKMVVQLMAISLITVILWFAVNIWWIYPFVKLAGSTYSGSPSLNSNLESLQGVSVNFPISQIVQLRQKFFFNTDSNKEPPWGTFYDSVLTVFVSIIGFLIVLFGLIKFRKSRYFAFLFLLFLIALFISKGTNPPLGLLFYKWLFANFTFTEIFRNSYEKFGVVFLLPYSIFFGLGVFEILNKFRRRNSKIIFFTLTFLTFFVYLTHPMWNGEYVFQKYFWIEVPKYYEETNQFLNKDISDSRVLMLPTIPFHGLRYMWGYRGDEPSRYIFDKAAVSKKLMYGYYSNKYSELSAAFKDRPDQVDEFLNQFNIRYIILNNDIDWQAVGSGAPNDFKDVLQRDRKIVFVKNFGNLDVYEYKSSLTFDLFLAEGKQIPRISYERLDQTHYKVNISGATQPFNLIFKESHNNLWEARIQGRKTDDHFLIYDYANAWKINKKGDFTIDVVLKVWPWD